VTVRRFITSTRRNRRVRTLHTVAPRIMSRFSSRSTRLTAAVVLAHAFAAPAATAQTPDIPRRDAIAEVLAPRVTPAFQSDVLVLGTTHLASERGRLRDAHLDPLLERLVAFAPTRIATEDLTGDEIALLAEREIDDPAAAKVLDMFARASLDAGREMQAALGITRVAAERRARALLQHPGTPDAAARLEATALLVAAYELNSAVLQWSYLTPDVRATDTTLTPTVRDLLERRLRSANEVVTIAMPLARRAGLQWLDAIDSQYDGLRTLALPPEVSATIFGDPARGALLDTARFRQAAAVRDAAFAAGDLLPLYAYLNAADHQVGDESQWHWLFEERHAGGAGRFRYAMWELRNLRQVARIVEVAGGNGTRAERVLVLVGASHKSALERALVTQLSVRVVPAVTVLGTARDHGHR